MSCSISGTSITLTRGDTLKVKIDIMKDDTLYVPQPGDSVRFALKHPAMNSKKTAYKDLDPLIIKNIPTNTMLLVLNPEDTKTLDFDTYVYDVEITFSDGTVDTFITQAIFKITPEVH